MSSKRPHTKSRLGCAQCKRRRIKCHGSPPSCAHCTRAGLECDFVQWNPAIIAIKELKLGGDCAVASALPPERITSLSKPAFTQTDLALMNHFTVNAAVTLPAIDSPGTVRIWKEDVPRLAQTHSFLAHAILAFAAAHRAYENSADALSSDIRLARQHYGRALAGFRGTVKDIGPDCEDALFPFCVLTCFVNMHMELSDLNSEKSATGVFITLMKTVQLSNGVLKPVHQRARGGPIKGLLPDLSSIPSHTPPIKLVSSLSRIEAAIPDDANCVVLEESLKLLRIFFHRVQPRPNSWALVMRWVMFLPLGFASLVEQKNKIALSLLAHWIVPVYHAPRKWFTGCWPEQLLREIEAILTAQGWEGYIQWPLAETFGPNAA